MAFFRRIWAGLLAAAVLTPTAARANERHFTYTYESGVLPHGARELEVWNTFRRGRPTFFTQVDHRFEFEVGLGKLQTAFYVNASSVAEDVPVEGRTSRFEYRGISSEWKYRLLDPVADPIGLALYGELEVGPTQTEIETKIIVDKRIGPLLFAGNLVGVHDWLFDTPGMRREIEAELDLAGAYFILPNLAIGTESRTDTEVVDGEVGYVATALGPVIAYSDEGYWAALSAMRQLPAPKRDEQGARFVFDRHELYNVRLIFSFHL